MRILLFFSGLLLCGTLTAQSPTDTASIGARIDSIYLNISFADTSQTNFDALRRCFAAHAQFVAYNGATYRRLELEEFIQNFERMIGSGQVRSFEEYEIDREVQLFGNIAHVFSRYETKLNGAFLARGTNSIQLLRRDDSWEITSIIWSDVPKQ